MVVIGREGGVGSVGFENSQLSKVAPSASKSMVSKLSKPSTTGNAHARHSSTAMNTQFQYQKQHGDQMQRMQRLTVALL